MKAKNIAYWTTTILLACGMFAGGLGQIFHASWNVDGILHLGYPLYFLYILGTWKILGVIALLVPRFPLVKEWAYAGFFFAMTGACTSYIANGDGFKEIAAPLLFAILTVVSWYLGPASRKVTLGAG